jgi:ribosomal protein S27E
VKTASCPSCGAPVSFRSAASVYAVCEFCRSTLLRQGEDLENLGRMADLLEDASLIQIGTEGKFRGQHFGVIGRIQLKHESGLWNEWHILFDDGRNAWLSEAGGEYVVSAQVVVNEGIPAFETLSPETVVTLAGRSFSVTDLETARCIAGQGELPFKVESGYDVNTADLRGKDRFLTIDYSETPPLVFVGHPTPYKDLNLANLREVRDPAQGGAPNIKARAFKCPHCAAPLTIHSPAIESLGCESCGSIIGVENENLKLLARAAQTVHEVPTLPLGSKGVLHGVDWEIIGFLKRRTTVDGVDYDWAEYLLFSAGEGFAWLVEDQGHWNYARTVSEIPRVSRGTEKFKYQGSDFRRFNAGQAEVVYVVGEFYWRVSVGERCETEDFISPPLMLSRELSQKEVTWSQGEYLDAETLVAAFRPKKPLPRAIGVYANQPNPGEERHRRICSMFWKWALFATVVQLAFIFLGAANVVLQHKLVFAPTQDEVTVTTPEFVLKSRARTLHVRHKTDIDNNWLSLTTTLIDKGTGQAWLGMQDIEHYSGVDGGESWAEGSKGDEIVFKAIPPGTYYLAIDYELGTDRRARVVDSIEIARNAPGWSNYVLVMIFLAAFPLFSRWRRSAFETRRWSESSLFADDSSGDDE